MFTNEYVKEVKENKKIITLYELNNAFQIKFKKYYDKNVLRINIYFNILGYQTQKR